MTNVSQDDVAGADRAEANGGMLVAGVLQRHDVRFLFTLCGGHISPILVGAKQHGIGVIDVRHEATAVFAADAVARLSGSPGVAAVTAGPGVTNTITAVKNAQMAQSPVVLLGGAAATMLKGRGALQDIDQMALMEPHVKWAVAVTRVADIVPMLEEAFARAQDGVPGPVFVELPVDLLYPQSLVQEMYGANAGGKGLRGRAMKWYLRRHAAKLFEDAWEQKPGAPLPFDVPMATAGDLKEATTSLRQAERPVLLIGSQATLRARWIEDLHQGVLRLGIPTFLSGMARGLLGSHALHVRHRRSKALKEADLIILAGVPCDFRLNYGRQLSRSATIISVNRSRDELQQNCKPDLAIQADAGAFLADLAAVWDGESRAWLDWFALLKQRDAARDAEIMSKAQESTEYINPLYLCQMVERCIGENSVLVGDGGDFVATASYIVRPRGPLSWLDPGVFGTLGAGAGFALGARLCRPDAEVWLLYGDGSAAYSLAEFDTFTRHGLSLIAVVGNDASWAQIAREQEPLLGDAVGTQLAYADYHEVAGGYGGAGLRVEDPAEVTGALQRAQELAAQGQAVLVNALLGRTDFRKGSISM
ncbi:MAG: thiamine pyrophosphate-binding protein [Chloroflexota bacterium]